MESVNSLESIFPQAMNTTAAKGNGELGQEQFLKLLVAQLENQDPSSPMENGEFLTQIAQFSMVSGIGDLEKGFNQLAETLQGNQVADAAALLHKDVLFDGNSVQRSAGQAVNGQVALDQSASDVRLRVMDATGVTVATVNLGTLSPGNASFNWNGQMLNGEQAPAGQYRLMATGFSSGAEQSLPLRLYGRVESVSVDSSAGQVALQLTDGETLSLSDVHEFK